MPLEHAILAILDYQPMTGYDLKKFLDISISHFWSTTQSHIYKSLEGLDKKSWVTAEIIPQEGKPNRKEYRITDAGRDELHRWLVTPLQADPVRQACLIQIFFSHTSTNEEISALFESRMHEFRERLDILRTVAQAAIDENAKFIGVERARQLWEITLDYGVSYYEFELAWHEKTLDTIGRLPPLTPPNPNPINF